MLLDTLSISTVKELANQKISSLSLFVSQCIRRGRVKGIQDELKLIKELAQGVRYLDSSNPSDDDKSTIASYLMRVGNLRNISNNTYTL